MRVQDVKPPTFISQLRCDRCGTEARHDEGDGFNNFLQIEFDASWGSAIGDETHVEVDLCHSCLKQTLGPWLRFSPSKWNQRPFIDGLNVPEDLPVQERRPLDAESKGSQ